MSEKLPENSDVHLENGNKIETGGVEKIKTDTQSGCEMIKENEIDLIQINEPEVLEDYVMYKLPDIPYLNKNEVLKEMNDVCKENEWDIKDFIINDEIHDAQGSLITFSILRKRLIDGKQIEIYYFAQGSHPDIGFASTSYIKICFWTIKTTETAREYPEFDENDPWHKNLP